MHTTLPFSCSLTPPCKTPSFPTALAINADNSRSYGSAMLTCPTMPPSKNVRGRNCAITHFRQPWHNLIFRYLSHGLRRPLFSTISNDTLHQQFKCQTHPLRPIHILIHHDKIPWSNLLFQAPHRAEPNGASNSQFPQRGHISSKRNFVRRDLMVQAMARKEGDGDWFRLGGRICCRLRGGGGGREVG